MGRSQQSARARVHTRRPGAARAYGRDHGDGGAMNAMAPDCELCVPQDLVAENALAYVRYDNHSLSRGHVLVIPRRHVANFFDMTAGEQAAVLSLLREAQRLIETKHAPDG